MSSPARTLGSWVPVPPEAWMSTSILLLYCPVAVAALLRADPLSKES
jgi:hypothetical protein